MLTASATSSCIPGVPVASFTELHRLGYGTAQIRAQLNARRWQLVGRAVVTHNAEPSRNEMCLIALVNAGPRAALTSFTSLATCGLRGWERDAVHVLVPGGARVTRPPGVPVRVHWTAQWASRAIDRRRLHSIPQSAVLAAAGLVRPRSACGLLAATVQQGLTRAEALEQVIDAEPHQRHHAALTAAVHDIAQGAQALSEIDFIRLCRRHGLPEPTRQSVRIEPNGRRRFVDAEWVGRRGRLVVEIDGALHLVASRWWKDQLRQNELVISGDRVLRFPTVVVRHEEALVIDQLQRGLELL